MKLKEIIADIRRELSFVKEELSDEDAKLYIEKRMMEHHDTVDFTIGQLQKIVMRIFYAIRSERVPPPVLGGGALGFHRRVRPRAPAHRRRR